MIRLLAPYIFVVLALCASLCLIFSLKVEIQIISRKQQRRIESMAARLNEAWQRPPDVIVTPATARSGINTNRRIQAIRMMRRGDDVSHVAAVLGVTRQEVELLVRVQTLVKGAGSGQ